MNENEMRHMIQIRNETKREIAKIVNDSINGDTDLFTFLRQSWLQFCDTWEQKCAEGEKFPSDAIIDFAILLTMNLDLKHVKKSQPDTELFRHLIDKTLALLCTMPNGVQLLNEIMVKINNFYANKQK